MSIGTDFLIEELSEDIDPSNFIQDINQATLPRPVAELSQRYDDEIGIREDFVWKWIFELFDHCTLGSVPDERLEATKSRKTLYTMFITVVDDIAEVDADRTTFRQARKIPDPGATVEYSEDVNRTALSLAADVWSEFERQLATAPRHEEFLTQFRYDTRQALNAIDYSLLVSETPAVATKTGALNFSTHNMVVFPYIDIDQMASPEFVRDDLSALRELLWSAQEMARIGNWLSTWEREIHEGDYSSGIVIWALQEGVVTPETLQSDPEAAIEAIDESDVEECLSDRWFRLYDEIENFDRTAASLDFDKAVDRLKTVMFFHLASEGYK